MDIWIGFTGIVILLALLLSYSSKRMKKDVAREEWQLEKTQQAIVEADAGNFATDKEMAELDKKWGYKLNSE